MVEHPEFLDYLQKAEEKTMHGSHTEWQQTTILGRLTLFLLKLGNNSFIHAIADALKDQEGGDSKEARMIQLVANLGSLLIGIFALYAIGRIIQVFIGKEIVINQEVIIEEEIKMSDLVKAKKEQDSKTASKRGKKAKNA